MKEMASLGESLVKLIEELQIEKPLQHGRAMQIWSEVVGKKIASKTEPVKIEHGTLIVHVKSPSWRNELQFYKQQIQHDLNEQLGEEIVKEIVFR